MIFETFQAQRLIEDAEKIAISEGENYLTAYQEFIEYFKGIDILTRHNIIIGISFTYSWMPTILDLHSEKLENAADILNSAKQGHRPSVTELEILKTCFNNSLVGSSKLLHFINPEIFAIWDSRVYRYLFKHEPYSYRVENADTYLEYLAYCDDIIQSLAFDRLHNVVEKKVGYKISKMRAIELIFFYNGAKS